MCLTTVPQLQPSMTYARSSGSGPVLVAQVVERGTSVEKVQVRIPREEWL